VDTSRGRVRVANARADLLLESGRTAEARAAFQEALRIADEANLPSTYEHRGRTLLGLGRAMLQQGHASAAGVVAANALRASAARADLSQTIDSLRLLATSLRSEGELDLAARTLRTAVALTERVPIEQLDGDQRATYLAAQHAVFAELTGMLSAIAQDEVGIWAAFEVAEAGRARSLRYALHQTATQRTEAPSPPDVVHVSLLQRLSSTLITAPENDPLALVKGLEELVDESVPSLPPWDRSALQRQLGRLGATLVQYAAGRDRMFAFVVDAQRIRLVDLGDSELIAASSARLVEHLRRSEISGVDVASSARDLASRVWWPVSQAITARHVLIAADDALHVVPFPLLPWARGSGNRLLVHEMESVMVPSASFVADLGRARKSRESRGIALIGDPVFRTDQWIRECRPMSKAGVAANDTPETWTEWLPSLPASRSEVLAIAEIAREARSSFTVDVHVGCDATAAALRNAARDRRAALHIATHARVDARRPRLSALVLAPGTEVRPDATFGLLDILGLDLSARLVTLSACDTSRGRLLPGEGVLGPAQAFLQVGVRTVIASHWRVEDVATAEFMRSFYARMLDENMSASEALRRTQLEKQTASASYTWAAFGIYGDPDTRI
jgi:CHAT domain-containing protein